MGWWSDELVAVPKVTFRRIVMMVEEIAYLEEGEELQGDALRTLAERLAVSILDEYVRGHFHESTHAAAKMMVERHKQRTLLESL